MEIIGGIILGVFNIFVILFFLFFLVGIISLIVKPFFKEEKKSKKQMSDKELMDLMYGKKQENTTLLWDINKEQKLKTNQEKILQDKRLRENEQKLHNQKQRAIIEIEEEKKREIQQQRKRIEIQERKALQQIEEERKDAVQRTQEFLNAKLQTRLKEEEKNKELKKLKEQDERALQQIERERFENNRVEINKLEEDRVSILKHEELVKASIEKLKKIQQINKPTKEKQTQLDFYEKNTWYSNEIQNTDGKFDSLRAISVGVINSISKQESDAAHDRLSNGVAILQNDIDLHKYIQSFGNMHKAKLLQSYLTCIHNQDFYFHKEKNIEIIDYGCGQGIGTTLLIEYLYSKPCNNKVSKIILLDPSEIALKRGSLHVKQILKSYDKVSEVYAIPKLLDDITLEDLETDSSNVKFHIFSNILDVLGVSIELISQKLISSQRGINYFICVSPNFFPDGTHKRNTRINNFMINLLNKFEGKIISERTSYIPNTSSSTKPWTRYEKVFCINFDKPK